MARKLEGGHSPSMKPDHEKSGVAAGLAVVVAEVVIAAAGDDLAVVAVEEAIKSPSRQSDPPFSRRLAGKGECFSPWATVRF